MAKWREDVAVYQKKLKMLGLDADANTAVHYFDNNTFETFPVSYFHRMPNLAEISPKKVERDLVSDPSKFLGVYLASRGLIDGKLLSDQEIAGQLAKIKNNKSGYKNLIDSIVMIRSRDLDLDRLDDILRKNLDADLGGNSHERMKKLYYTYVRSDVVFKSLFGRKGGDKDYARALLVLGLLRLPSLEKVIKTGAFPIGETDAEHIANVQKLIEENPRIYSSTKRSIANILRNVSMEKSVDTDFKLNDKDARMYAKFVDEVDKIRGSSPDMGRLAKMLYEDKIRSGKVFLGIDYKGGSYNYEKLEKVDFSDLAGDKFEENAAVIKNLLKRTENESFKDGQFVVIQGPPGNGKSDTILATLNNIPKNARGIIIETDESTREIMGNIRKISELHPDLYFFAAIDDIDFIIKSRKGYLDHPSVNILLNMDSIYGHSKMPDKTILIGATNRPYAIDPAIIGRTGRVRYILSYPNPDKKNRGQIIDFLSERYKIEVENKTNFVKVSDGFSGDDLNYVFKEAKDDGLVSIDEVFLKKVVDQINERKKMTSELHEMFRDDIFHDKERTQKEEDDYKNSYMYF